MTHAQLTIDIDKDKYADFVDKMATITNIYKKTMRGGIFTTSGIDAEALDGEVDTPPTPPKVMTPYDVLGVPTSARADDITVAYRSLLKKHHPDTGDGDTTQFQRVRDAFSLIGNAQKRARYDKAVKLLQKQEQVWGDEALKSVYKSGNYYQYGSASHYTSGSAYSSQASRNGLRVGYQIPQIGGVVGNVSYNYTQGYPGMVTYLIEVDATLPQWVLRDWQLWHINLSDGDWWMQALKLDSRYRVGNIQAATNNIIITHNIQGSLGAQFRIEVIEL